MALNAPERTPTDEVLDFLLSAPTPEQILALHPSPQAQTRIGYLLYGNRNGTLTDQECAELDSYLQVEYFVRRLKICAQMKIANDK